MLATTEKLVLVATTSRGQTGTDNNQLNVARSICQEQQWRQRKGRGQWPVAETEALVAVEKLIATVATTRQWQTYTDNNQLKVATVTVAATTRVAATAWSATMVAAETEALAVAEKLMATGATTKRRKTSADNNQLKAVTAMTAAKVMVTATAMAMATTMVAAKEMAAAAEMVAMVAETLVAAAAVTAAWAVVAATIATEFPLPPPPFLPPLHGCHG